MIENPFVTLEIKKDLLVREYEAQNWSGLKSFAQEHFKALAKVFHPDKGGDPERMARYTAAIALLGSEDEVRLFVGELMDDAALKTVRLQEMHGRSENRLRVQRDALINSLAYVNQFELLAVDRPSTLLVFDDDVRYIVDVLSPSTCRVRRSNASLDDVLNLTPSETEFSNGEWVEHYIDGNHRLVGKVSHGELYHDLYQAAGVRIVGCIRPRKAPPVTSTGQYVQINVAPRGDRQISWEAPQDAWFLGDIEFDVEPGTTLVVQSSQGYLSLLGMTHDISEL